MNKHRTTLYLLDQFENTICKLNISKTNDEVTFLKEDNGKLLATMTCTKQEAINILNELIDWINGDD